MPVIFLTARDTSSDTVTGLALGGDDYVTKPFSVESLVARVRAVLRRAARTPGGAGAGSRRQTLRAGDLELDESRWTVHRAGTPVELSPTEFRLLAYLMRHEGRVLTREQLLENVWGWDYAGQSQIVETYISYLRRKLDPLGPPIIHTQRGVGYSLRLPGTGQEAEPARRDERPPAAVAACPAAGRAAGRHHASSWSCSALVASVVFSKRYWPGVRRAARAWPPGGDRAAGGADRTLPRCTTQLRRAARA